jgi:hypothetical protein
MKIDFMVTPCHGRLAPGVDKNIERTCVPVNPTPWLLAAGALSAAASVAHLGCILGGPAWYRFFGAGEAMARAAERGSPRPALVTLVVAIGLAIWAAYAFSGAGIVPRAPVLRPVLVLITAIYLLRAAALPVMLKTMADRGVPFLVWSSLIVLVIGLVHAVGVWMGWAALGG